MVPVPLSNSPLVAWVDEADAPAVLGRSWHLHDHGYARCGKLYLHRMLMAPGPGLEVDHIDGDGLNCQRENMRVVTHAQNGQNVRTAPHSSRHRGVSWWTVRGKWMVRVKVNGQPHFGGYFDDEDEAGRAAARLRRELLPYATA